MSTYSDTTHLFLREIELREAEERAEQIRRLDGIRQAAAAAQLHGVRSWLHHLRAGRPDRFRPLPASGRRFGMAP